MSKGKESRFRDESHIVIQGWMPNKLKLRGNELLVYAVIFGFTKDGENWFEGSVGYLADAIGSTNTTIHKQLNSLVEKGAIIKGFRKYRNQEFPIYKACLEHIDKNIYSLDPIKNLNTPSKESLDNNITNINIYKEGEVSKEIKSLKDLDYNSREYKIGFNKVEFRRRLLELGADEMHVNDWFKYRDSKKSSTYSHTAFSRFINECEKYDCSVAFAVEECASKEWIGFEGRWSKLEQKPQRDIIKELQADKDRFESFFNADLDLRRWSVRASKSEKFKFIEELNKHFINDSNKRYTHTYSKALEFALEYVKNK